MKQHHGVFKWNSIGLNVLKCFVLEWMVGVACCKPKVHRHIGNTVRPSSDKVIASNAFFFTVAMGSNLLRIKPR